MRDIFKFDGWSATDALLYLEFMSYHYRQCDNMDMDHAAKLYRSRQYYIDELGGTAFTDTLILTDTQCHINMYHKYRISYHNGSYTIQYKTKLLWITIWKKIEAKFSNEMDAKLWILKRITNTKSPQEIRDAKLKEILT